MNDATPSRDALPAIAVGGGLAGTAFAIALARARWHKRTAAVLFIARLPARAHVPEMVIKPVAQEYA